MAVFHRRPSPLPDRQLARRGPPARRPAPGAPGPHPGDLRGPELVATLTAASPKFAELWQEHTTARFRSYRKGYQHPAAGLLSLDYIKLAAASDSQQHLIVMLPADQATADKLRQLR
jgi:MmyB-like transcription regulator ligand binding domain